MFMNQIPLYLNFLSDCLVGFYHPRELGMDESPIQGLVWQRSINQLPVPLAPALPDFSSTPICRGGHVIKNRLSKCSTNPKYLDLTSASPISPLSHPPLPRLSLSTLFLSLGGRTRGGRGAGATGGGGSERGTATPGGGATNLVGTQLLRPWNGGSGRGAPQIWSGSRGKTALGGATSAGRRHQRVFLFLIFFHLLRWAHVNRLR